ncbi:MAG: hypothetical protein PVF94_08440, partial [Desulfobacterales bacterium]
MGMVHVDEVEVDMVLDDDVRDINSRLLLAKGQKIQSKHIRIFKIWGITEVCVAGNHGREKIAESDIDPDTLERITENTKTIFKHVDLSHPAIKELFRISVLYRSRQGILHTDKNIPSTNSEDLKDRSICDVKKMIAQNRIKLPEMPSTAFELNEVV